MKKKLFTPLPEPYGRAWNVSFPNRTQNTEQKLAKPNSPLEKQLGQSKWLRSNKNSRPQSPDHQPCHSSRRRRHVDSNPAKRQPARGLLWCLSVCASRTPSLTYKIFSHAMTKLPQKEQHTHTRRKINILSHTHTLTRKYTRAKGGCISRAKKRIPQKNDNEKARSFLAASQDDT